MTAPTLRCAACAVRQPDDFPGHACPACGGLFEVEHPAPALRGDRLAASFLHVDGVPGASWRTSGVWRFQSVVHPSARDVVSWPEGNTPLLSRPVVARYAGCDGLLLKHEGMNPTGSFKERGARNALEQLDATSRARGCSMIKTSRNCN